MTNAELEAGAKAFQALRSGEIGEMALNVNAPVVHTFEQDETSITLANGMYITLGGTSGGKSIILRSILSFIGRVSVTAIRLPISMFEPGSPQYPDSRNKYALFSKPESFLKSMTEGDLLEYLGPVIDKRRQEDGPPCVVALDSVGDPLVNYDLEARRSQPASQGGQVPADAAFCTLLNNFAEYHKLIVLAAISTDHVPFAAKLYRATQGIIVSSSSRTFTKEERATGRNKVSVSLPEQDIKVAAESLFYTQKRKPSSFGGIEF